MGLDMYLSTSKYLAGYEFYQDVARTQYHEVLRVIDMADVAIADTPSLTIDITVGYWRKANAIHKWFVDNCQGGVDDCRRAYVAYGDLETLLALCKEILATVKWVPDQPPETERWERKLESINLSLVTEKLPPQAGFFFGGTSVDVDYVMDLENTVGILERVLGQEKLRGCDFYYQSSW